MPYIPKVWSVAKDGRKYKRIQVYNGQGKSPVSQRFYRREGITEKRANDEAEKFAFDFENKVKSGKFENREAKKKREKEEAAERAKIRTVKRYIEEVYMEEKRLSENAKCTYQMFIDKYILPPIGSLLMTEVETQDLKAILLKFQKGHSHASCIKLYNILHGIFKAAYLDETIEKNPMDRVNRPKPRSDEEIRSDEEKWYSAEELAYILKSVENEPLKWRAYILLAADTGARRGEICGCQWSDIDWEERLIHFNRNLQYTSGAKSNIPGAGEGVYSTTLKNRKTRKVDIGEDTIQLLKQWRLEQLKEGRSNWIFNQNGTDIPMHPQSPTRYFKKLEKKYGIKDFHPHKLRHTSASIAIDSGASPKAVAERMGHKDASITLKVYAHADQEGIRRVGETVRSRIAAQR